jgi:hypothetical protein
MNKTAGETCQVFCGIRGITSGCGGVDQCHFSMVFLSYTSLLCYLGALPLIDGCGAFAGRVTVLDWHGDRKLH